MDFFSEYKSQIEKYLTKSQILTLQLLIWLLQVQKDVRIERLASCLPIPILYESRRKKIQRFLVSSSLSLSLFWFPIIKSIVEQEFKRLERLTLVLDRTQWQDNNVFMISVIWRNSAPPALRFPQRIGRSKQSFANILASIRQERKQQCS